MSVPRVVCSWVLDMQVLHSCLDGQTARSGSESGIPRLASFAKRRFTYIKTNPPLALIMEIAYKHNKVCKNVCSAFQWLLKQIWLQKTRKKKQSL